jgi:hypothetical protein
VSNGDGRGDPGIRVIHRWRAPPGYCGDRQFVVVDGEKVYGLFLIPEQEWSDVPLVVTLPKG